MTISFEIPHELESELRDELGDVASVARDALLVEGYRRGAISLGWLAELLGIGVVEAPEWLAAHGVSLNYGPDDLAADRRTLDRLLGGIPQ